MNQRRIKEGCGNFGGAAKRHNSDGRIYKKPTDEGKSEVLALNPVGDRAAMEKASFCQMRSKHFFLFLFLK